VQAKENDRQRGYGKVWDTVLIDYEGVELREICELMGLLYALAIKGDFKRHQVALDS
jgi:hypothetical protein